MKQKELLTIKFRKIDKEARLPEYAHPDDAGFDLYSIESVEIYEGEFKLIRTGLAAEIPPGWYVSFRDRSGLAAKYGIHVLAGVVDSNYRGEWIVVLKNLGEGPYQVEKGERIAQAMLEQSVQAKIVEVTQLSSTDRGEKGFGSSGRK